MSEIAVRDRLIVALDGTPEESLAIARSLTSSVRWVKVGMTLFYEAGPEVIEHLLGLGFDVFLDLKLHDIPHQVEGAAYVLGGLGVGMLTVHASGGPVMIAAAVSGARKGAQAAGKREPDVIAVTVLTSLDASALEVIGFERDPEQQVRLLAKLAQQAGAAGVVCSPREAAAMRELLGAEALVVTPGVRPAGSDRGDQSRVATPAQALAAGASHLVVGRPITAAATPLNAAELILELMEGNDDTWPNR